MKRGGWFDDASGVSVVEVARALGLTIGRDGKSFGPCPNCGAATRNNPGRAIDRRGRCRVSEGQSGSLWACCSNGSHGCGATGSGPGLVAWQLTGEEWRRGDVEASARVRAWYAGNGWCDPAPGESAALPRGRVVAPIDAPLPPSRPDVAELAQLWFHAPAVTADPEAANWLTQRGLDPARVAALDLARVLPVDLSPTWAHRGWRSWQETGHRLLVGLWEPDPLMARRLRLASVHARCVRACDDKNKAASPQGHSHKGLVMATAAAGDDFLADGVAQRLLTICEGVPDFLALGLQSAAMRGALLGGISGSASAEILAQVPADWTVAVATHADPGGDDQARAWQREIERRGCRYVRCRRQLAA